MLLNFARGGAAINVLARHAGARVVVVDMGVAHPLPARGARRSARAHRRRARATSRAGPAMTRAQAVAAIAAGARIADELARDGVGLLGIGEMGIANTTAASALAAVFTGAPPEEVTGRGTGIDDATLAPQDRRHPPRPRRSTGPTRATPIGALAKVGGFEIAGLARRRARRRGRARRRSSSTASSPASRRWRRAHRAAARPAT